MLKSSNAVFPFPCISFLLVKKHLYMFFLFVKVFWLWFSSSVIKKRSDYECGLI